MSFASKIWSLDQFFYTDSENEREKTIGAKLGGGAARCAHAPGALGVNHKIRSFFVKFGRL